ncbi:MAG: transporter substrate-binding domain-containing protein, partial [Oscillibacter sp.]|nr:transporter substrate-binding domain-containing protein [Oscillibacter sp.]
MKKFFATVLALTMALSLAACGAKEEPAASTPAASTPAASSTVEETGLTTVTPGKLTVATSPDFAPYEFYAINEAGEPELAGFDMALAQYIADYLGLELEVIPMDFDGTILELQNKNVDLGMAGYSPDPDRADAMDFSDIYITGGQSFVCLDTTTDKFP